ncbi:hypothetical protein DVV91_17250 [Clostridium botulinum]|uniref:hypothetical protein n=1 Tax=Clostridium botulinum TaxID=1491 RepID=UPI001966D791|nr:hypothetical protein [Clostridium botulinum]MBN1076069.1 hypothetical protein [Clostridium botulinum]
MINEGANIWFARNNDGNIVTIDKINENNRHDDYKCPICGSNIIPKAIKEDAQMTRHFAHRDASKCDRETQIHFFVKNELLKQGDSFTISIDNDIKEFICKEILIEKQHKTEFGIYNPDITVITEDNKTIYFEVNHTNKKKIEDYLDMWIELNNIVVEIDSKDIINGKFSKEFNAKFYESKCFNIKQEDNEYYELIGKIKLNNIKYPKDQVEKLNWLWKDINKYLLGEIEISEISNLIQAIENEELKGIVVTVLRKNKCSGIVEDYIKYNIDKSLLKLSDKLSNFSYNVEKCRLWYQRIYHGYRLTLKYNDLIIFSEEIPYDLDDFTHLISDIYIKYMNLDRYIKTKYGNYKLIFYTNGYSGYCNPYIYFEGSKCKQYLNDVYEDCINFIDKEIDKIVKLDKFKKNIKSIENDIKKEYNSINKIVLSEDCITLDFTYKYDFIIKEYSIDTYYNTDVEYYIDKIKATLELNVNDVICELIKFYYPNITKCFTANNNTIYIGYLQDSIPINNNINICVDKKDIENLINIYNQKIKNIDEYNNIFNEYYIKCKNTKNNYNIILLDSGLDIYYKDKIMESIKYYEINDINKVLFNNIQLSKTLIEDLEDYYNFEIFKNIVNNINLRYHEVYGYWRLIYKNEQLKLYKNNEFIDYIDIPKDFIYEDDLYANLIYKISDRIRIYLYD